jgi:hypothetical protein
VFAAVTIAAAVLGGLTQRAWRDFGAVPRIRPAMTRQPVPEREATSPWQVAADLPGL